ncbi:MAG: hypothetical protein AAGI53_07015 [Planctomycetota bacterium]
MLPDKSFDDIPETPAPPSHPDEFSKQYFDRKPSERVEMLNVRHLLRLQKQFDAANRRIEKLQVQSETRATELAQVRSHLHTAKPIVVLTPISFAIGGALISVFPRDGDYPWVFGFGWAVLLLPAFIQLVTSLRGAK